MRYRTDKINTECRVIVVKTKRLLLLSHCDDEIFLLPFLLDSDIESTVVFFSTRQIINDFKNVRKTEAMSANQFFNRFQKLETVFLEPEVRDGLIHLDFSSDHLRFLTEVIDRVKPDELITLNYEGGHQDHDTVEVIAGILSSAKGIKMITSPAYSSVIFTRKFFKVMKSEERQEKIKVKRLRNLYVAFRIILIYKSQYKTWVGLAPFIVMNYAFFSFWVNRVDFISEPKLLDRCFYEFRDRAAQGEVLVHLKRIISLSRNSR